MLGQGVGALKKGGGGLEPPYELWWKFSDRNMPSKKDSVVLNHYRDKF